MTDAVPITVDPARPGRRTKFTPERIQQIINLVERGKKREEIAEIIGVTTAALQVACSRLGVSLRRPSIDVGVNFFPRRRTLNGIHNGEPGSLSKDTNDTEPNHSNGTVVPSNSSKDHHAAAPQLQKAATFEIRMRYRGEERVTELPLDPVLVGYLAFEAEFRGMRIGELIKQLIVEGCNLSNL
jgi:hypothetical protein